MTVVGLFEAKGDCRGRMPFDVNLRTTIAFREIVEGHGGIETFLWLYEHGTTNDRINLQ